ncbi:MAG: efflux RND transporter permease subunit [Elusimicrobia bacterium]|nr:efflux RND transporter permease subunit [Elusimicrobiota bacterium]
MNFMRLPVERPVTTIMIFVGVVIMGVISWSRIPQELFPSMEYPQVTIVTKYEGAGPEESEKLISKLVEETLGTVKNVKKVASVSKEGASIVTVEFRWGTNMDLAAMDVREKIDLIKEALPKDAHEPIVLKFNPMQVEAMILSVSYTNEDSDPWKMADLRTFCKKSIKDELERLDGVAKIEIRGGEKKEILVEIDKGRLLANQVSITDIISSLRDANVTYPAGTIKEETSEYLVKTVGEFQTLNDIAQLSFGKRLDTSERRYRQRRIRNEEPARSDKIVFIRDIADVKDSLKEKTGFSRYNGRENISLGIYPQSGANLIRISDLVRKKLTEITGRLPANIDVKIIYDQSEFVSASINDIYMNALEGGICSLIILLIFMRSLSASIIINLAIPLSTFVTLIFMYFQNISINTMSLGGIVIGFGMVVDNANVVMENIIVAYHKEPTKDKKDLIFDSVNELVPTVLSSTITTIAIFIPFIFITGMAGQLFKQLALTISFGMVASIFVALFLVPTLLLKMDLSKFSTDFGKKFAEHTFTPLLRKVLQWPWRKLLMVLGVYTALAAVVFYFIPKEFMPKSDDRHFVLNINMLPETPLKDTNDLTRRIEKIISRYSEVKDLSAVVGSTGDELGTAAVETLGSYQARIVGRLTEKGLPTEEIVGEINSEIQKWNIRGMETEFITQQGLFGTSIGASSGLTLEVKGKDLDKLRTRSEDIKKAMGELPEFYGIKISPMDLVPELKVQVDRERASLFGLSTQDISAMALAAIKGYVATKLKLKDEERDIRVCLRPEDRDTLQKVMEMTAYSPWGMTIQLKQVSQAAMVRSVPEIKRSEGQRIYLVTAGIKGNFSDAVRKLQNILDEMPPKDDITTAITGEMLAIRESMQSSVFAMILGAIIIYMILASEFEALVQPLIVMCAVPLGVLGAVYTLFFTGQSINSISMLGMIMLTGHAVSISIFLVDRYNFMSENNAAGLPLDDLIIQATVHRLRPVLMTTMVTIIDLMPLALGLGKHGSGATQPMAITVIGGLSFALVLSLLFVPLIYRLTSKKELREPASAILTPVIPE